MMILFSQKEALLTEPVTIKSILPYKALRCDSFSSARIRDARNPRASVSHST